MRSYIIAIAASIMLLIPARAQDSWDGEVPRETVADGLPERPVSSPLTEVYRWTVGEQGLILQTKGVSAIAGSFMVVGDLHHTSPSPDFNQSMLNELTQAAIQEEVDFVFFQGDLGIEAFTSPAEEDSVLKDWRLVLESLQDQNIRLYACRGNSEMNNLQSWNSLFSGAWAFPQNGPAEEKNLTYTVEYENLLFVVLDQYTLAHRVNQVWLDSILSASTSDHIFVAGHEPAFKLAYTHCLGMYHCDRDLFWESLSDAGVEAYFCGLDHFYDHAIIYDGHVTNAGDLHHITVGTGGGTLHADSEYDGDNGTWRPERLFHEKEYGYMLVELTGEEVKMTWKHRTGPNMYVDGGDSFILSTEQISQPERPPGKVNLYNYPNPFHSSTTISYQLSEYSHVELSVYDLTGRKVTTLVNESQPSGKHLIEWSPAGLRQGVYLCIFQTNDLAETIQMFVIE